jgi:hypothetical protein
MQYFSALRGGGGIKRSRVEEQENRNEEEIKDKAARSGTREEDHDETSEDELLDTGEEESYSLHSSSEALPAQAPVNWTSALLSKQTGRARTLEPHTEVTEKALEAKWFDSSDDDAGAQSRGSSQALGASARDGDVGQQEHARGEAEKSKRKRQKGGAEMSAKQDGADEGVQVVRPAKGVKVRPLVLPTRRASAANSMPSTSSPAPPPRASTSTSASSNYHHFRTRLRGLLAKASVGKEHEHEQGAGEEGGTRDSARQLDCGVGSEGGSDASGDEEEHEEGKNGKVRKKRGAGSASPQRSLDAGSVGAVLMSQHTIDALISRALRGDAAAKAAAGPFKKKKSPN